MGIARSSAMMRVLYGTSHSGPLVTKVRSFSLEAATKIAMGATLRQFPKATGVSWGDIKLLKNVCDCPEGRIVTWFWDFSVWQVIDPHPERTDEPPTILPARDTVILLDGEVVQPISVK